MSSQLKRLWGAAAHRWQEATPRERKIYFVYGVLAWTYSLWLLAFVASRFGGFLVERYQAWGFFLFSICLVALSNRELKLHLRKKLANGFLQARDFLGPQQAPIDPPADAIEQSQPIFQR